MKDRFRELSAMPGYGIADVIEKLKKEFEGVDYEDTGFVLQPQTEVTSPVTAGFCFNENEVLQIVIWAEKHGAARTQLYQEWLQKPVANTFYVNLESVARSVFYAADVWHEYAIFDQAASLLPDAFFLEDEDEPLYEELRDDHDALLKHAQALQDLPSIHDMLNDIEFQVFLGSKLGNDLFISDPTRADRLHEYAKEGMDGSTYAEQFEDWREFIEVSSYPEFVREALRLEVTSIEECHSGEEIVSC